MTHSLKTQEKDNMKYTYTSDIWGSSSFSSESLETFQAEVEEIYKAYEQDAPEVWEASGYLMIEDENGSIIPVGIVMEKDSNCKNCSYKDL
tara:strand:- start:206 stop:478 length:273 start_codon:yes stop_codon:yes gene_type:complete